MKLSDLKQVDEGFLDSLASGAKSLVQNHPFMTGMAIGWATDAIKKYNKAKQTAIKFYAKDLPERVAYGKMVDKLVKGSGYHIVKQGYSGAGYSWELNKR